MNVAMQQNIRDGYVKGEWQDEDIQIKYDQDRDPGRRSDALGNINGSPICSSICSWSVDAMDRDEPVGSSVHESCCLGDGFS